MVPGLEDPGEVNVQGLLDVDNDKVIELTCIACISTKYRDPYCFLQPFEARVAT